MSDNWNGKVTIRQGASNAATRANYDKIDWKRKKKVAKRKRARRAR